MGAAGEIGLTWHGVFAFIRAGFEKDGALERFIASELATEPIHLLRNECLHVVVLQRLVHLSSSKLGILRRQGAQECPGQIHVAVRQMKTRVSLVELKRMAALAMRREVDPLIKAPLRIRL